MYLQFSVTFIVYVNYQNIESKTFVVRKTLYELCQ